MFEVGQRIRTTRIDYNDLRPAWVVGDTGTITSLGNAKYHDAFANVKFDQFDGEDIVNFDEMEAI